MLINPFSFTLDLDFFLLENGIDFLLLESGDRLAQE